MDPFLIWPCFDFQLFFNNIIDYYFCLFVELHSPEEVKELAKHVGKLCYIHPLMYNFHYAMLFTIIDCS